MKHFKIISYCKKETSLEMLVSLINHKYYTKIKQSIYKPMYGKALLNLRRVKMI